MKKVVAFFLIAVVAMVALFAAEDVKERDNLTVTTSVGAINYIAFVDASSEENLDPATNPTPMGSAYPSVGELANGYTGIGVAVRTNKPYSLDITLTGDPMSRGTEVYPLTVAKGTKEVIATTTSSDVQTTADDGASVTFETADDSDSLSLAENNESPTGLRMFYYPLTLTCNLTKASAGDYTSTITVTIQRQEGGEGGGV